ncbi:MAG: DEAD/DEAH box helicase [Acidobacteria bacterium]|nr:DEAD/DEAH box helicase [Acidobacteriota bacterium]
MSTDDAPIEEPTEDVAVSRLIDVNGPRFETMVEAAAWGEAGPEDLAVLAAHEEAWRRVLIARLYETDESLERVRALRRPDDQQIITDLEHEQRMLEVALDRLLGIEPEPGELPPGVNLLQLSWVTGRIVAWLGGPDAPPATVEQLRAALESTDAPDMWAGRAPVLLPSGDKAVALEANTADVLGWLLSLSADPPEEPIGPSARWLSVVAAFAVSLVARGAMVPTVRRSRSGRRSNSNRTAFAVTWSPALVDAEHLRRIADAMPGAVAALSPSVDGATMSRSVLGEVVDVICHDAARRVDVPAAPDDPRSITDAAETFLARLDGTPFDIAPALAGELTNALERWSTPVTSKTYRPLIVQLDPPDSGDAWHLAVFAPGKGQQLVPIEVALVNAGNQRREVEGNLLRLERLFPALQRPGSLRRGEVVLSQVEAWELMTEVGPALADAGFDVRVPALSRRRPTPSLRLWAESTGETSVGAHQLANVSWTAVFDDIELTAADIARLAKEARPLVRSGGRWVALDHADLAAAAEALAERARKPQMTGAEMLRQALGLDGTALAGGIAIEGSGWAADLLAKASTASLAPAQNPKGFNGELRSYQAEALAWLQFLDTTGLGGCLALDMGLGKTPTILAHLVSGADSGQPALVIAPPAVVGNWAAEAARFTPRLKVVVHHGASRADAVELPRLAERNDVIITTYSTAVRDIEALERIHWGRVVLDEAQAIKNPANDTAQQLRRLDATTRLALTGTPIENGLGDLWAILDFTNPGLVGPRPQFISQLSGTGEGTRDQGERALRALNGILVFRRTKSEPAIAAELPDRIDELDRCSMTPEQIGLYQAVLDSLVTGVGNEAGTDTRNGAVLAAITALKQICNHPVAYRNDDGPLAGRSGKLARLEEILEQVYASGERALVFTHFAEWGQKLAGHLSGRFGIEVGCYHGGLSRGARDALVTDFQALDGPGALVLSLKAGGTGLNLTNANHVILYDRWWNPAVEDQARDRAWRIGQNKTVIAHRLVCPGTVDERVEEVVAGKRHIADLILPKSSSLGDLDPSQLQAALGLRTDALITEQDEELLEESLA